MPSLQQCMQPNVSLIMNTENIQLVYALQLVYSISNFNQLEFKKKTLHLGFPHQRCTEIEIRFTPKILRPVAYS